ncbi:hypothetical protein C8J57DRAFT_1626017 [Mycena rebaudengoi]|nr:hypothetical protein C8J57DRAFT_1626017 [Mycena rebaudengoi]
MPDKLSVALFSLTPTVYSLNRLRKNDSTAVRLEDVLLLENHIPSGGSATWIHTSIEAETWVEHNYDTALLKTIRSIGLGGPMATMLSTDIPALAIFGSALDNRVLELAKTLSDLSMFPVMVRPVADDPLVNFIEERGNMAPEASSQSTGGDYSDTEEDMISDSESTDTESEDENDYRGESGVLRLRGGFLHRHRNLNLVDDLDYIAPSGIARPDGSHRARVRLHLRLRENILYDVSICSKNAFKFQTEKAEHPHELTEPITRPQLLSCIDLKVEARPIEVLLDRSYSNLGFVVRRAESIAGQFETDVGDKTYIADIKITEPLTITEDRVVDLAVNGSHSPPATDMTPLTPHAANSLAIALFDESKDAVKRNMQELMDKVSALFDRKGRAPELIDLPLHEYVARGWDATNRQWRNTVWPTLDQAFVGCPRSSAAWNLALRTNQNPYDQDGNFDPRTLYGPLEEDGMEVDA